jgi:hypothetical protein
MPRFYFDLKLQGRSIDDEHGHDYDDLEAAELRARQSAGELASEFLQRGTFGSIVVNVRKKGGDRAVSTETRELYASPNGDRWFLAREAESQQVYIQHVANAQSHLAAKSPGLSLAPFSAWEETLKSNKLCCASSAPSQNAFLMLTRSRPAASQCGNGNRTQQRYVVSPEWRDIDESG